MNTNYQAKVIVIGAGISGLATAYYIKKAGHDVLVLEKSQRTGGCIDTVQENGYQIETGPNSFRSSATDLISLLGIKSGDGVVATKPKAQ